MESLKKLLKGLDGEIRGKKDLEITGLTADSRKCAPGNLFIAKKGYSVDGTQFISQALKAGACAIVSDLYDPFIKVPQVITPSPAHIEAKLAARYYGEPSKKLFVVGVTGSKGKTSTTYLIKHILGDSSGLIGGIETIVKNERFSSELTTHDVIFNHKWLFEMVEQGCKEVVLEVSSHGLHQNRVDEIDFDLAVLTNLLPDHLDYHGSMEEYAKAKKRLFTLAKRGIFNADCPLTFEKGVSFGIESGDIRAKSIAINAEGTDFVVDGVRFHTPLLGKYNVYNTLASIAVGLERGFSLKTLSEKLATFGGTPGRLERVGNVFIDFAHTKESLEEVLSTLKAIAKGQIITVVGGAGNRPIERRIGLAEVASTLSDVVIVTSDNPRKENPQDIANQMVVACVKKPIVELNRRLAIQCALKLAKRDDFVLIAGKGHEKVQILAHQSLPFDDVQVVKEFLFEVQN